MRIVAQAFERGFIEFSQKESMSMKVELVALRRHGGYALDKKIEGRLLPQHCDLQPGADRDVAAFYQAVAQRVHEEHAAGHEVTYTDTCQLLPRT